jgi:hypothetical protein
VVIAADSLGVADRADITLVGGFSARTGHGQRAIAERAERARDAGSPLVFVELEVALNRPGEHAARRLARLGSVDLWPMTDRARFVGSAGDLTEYLAELAQGRTRPAEARQPLRRPGPSRRPRPICRLGEELRTCLTTTIAPATPAGFTSACSSPGSGPS